MCYVYSISLSICLAVGDPRHIYEIQRNMRVLAGVLPSRLAQPARDARGFDLMCGAEDHGTVYVFFSHVPYLWVQNEKTKSTDEESYGNL